MMVIFLLLFFAIKHFLCDFVYQPPYMWKNKGTYGHLGGICHAGLHAVVSLLGLVCFVSLPVLAFVCLLEFIIHYHMDWFKMSYNKKKGWAANTHNQFWVLLGVDQLVHQLTYILMAFLM